MTAIEEATALKQKGNKAVANHEWINAIEAYTQAIELNDQDATYFCNRAQVPYPNSNPQSYVLISFRQTSN